jgi:hypothetical protein
VFGRIFTVIIALEFKKSLLVVTERRESVVQIRSVVIIALLAVYRKVIIPDLTETDALHVMAFAAVITVRGLSQPTFATKSANSGPIACPSALANAWRRSGAIMRSRAAKMHDDGLNAHAAPESLLSKHRAPIDPCATAITAVSAADGSCEVPAMHLASAR